MRCPACRHDNRPEARFFEACGAAFVASCPGCKAGVVVGQRFCHACGAVLGGGPNVSVACGSGGDEAAVPLLRSERKQVTVVFADLQGSLALIGGEDTEGAQRVLDGLLRAMEAAVQRYGGLVCKRLGDGVMALFGAPQAQEDQPPGLASRRLPCSAPWWPTARRCPAQPPAGSGPGSACTRARWWCGRCGPGSASTTTRSARASTWQAESSSSPRPGGSGSRATRCGWPPGWSRSRRRALTRSRGSGTGRRFSS